MSFEPKRRKIDGEPPPARSAFIQPPKRRPTDSTQTSLVHYRNAAVAQAHQDGWTANFRIFDSPFRNFLVPVIPTPSELGQVIFCCD
ncbi:unnamed protein product [Withania somnifera]